MNEMKYNGANTGLNSNPEGLYVYRKSQHRNNTTLAGVGQPLVILHLHKHVMPSASLGTGVTQELIRRAEGKEH